MTAAAGLSGGGGLALLRIARASGEVVSVQDADPPLLPHAAGDLVGKHWEDVLQPTAPVTAALADAIDAAMPVSLPPLLLQTSSTKEVVAILQLLPQAIGDESILLVRPLWRGYDEARAGPIGAGDVVAVLGVDRLAYDDNRGLAQTGALMQSLRQGLLQILRAQDSAASPAGSAILLVLRETELESAADISRALLSHLRPLLAKQGEGAAGARIHIGLARAEEGRSALVTVLAANGALLQAQMSGGKEPVCIASESDDRRLIAQAMNASGVFSELLAASEATPSPGRVPESPEQGQSPTVVPLESGIDGYVDDNMEGAIDQAVFLAQVDMPVAVVGPRGTGKLYVARIIHQEAGGEPDGLVYIDCREFRGRQSALRRIAEELEGSEGKTLVFKSPHLMHPEVQRKLARQLSTRMLADATPPRYLPAARYVALFPDSLDRLARHGGLEPALASVFAGYPIRVPPIRARGQAVLRWAHKILGQESARRDRRMQGFTPDAEEAMLQHDWPGNISEMRQVITSAMDHTDKEWITPVDLGLFKGVSPQEEPRAAGHRPFLEVLETPEPEPAYAPSSLEQLGVSLGEALNAMLQADAIKPLGAWLDDEVVLAACERYRGDVSKAAGFLHTRSRNVNRWIPKIHARDHERTASLLWQEPSKLVRQWIRETAPLEESPQELLQDMLLQQVIRQCERLKVSARAEILGVSAPTYHKRLQALQDRQQGGKRNLEHGEATV